MIVRTCDRILGAVEIARNPRCRLVIQGGPSEGGDLNGPRSGFHHQARGKWNLVVCELRGVPGDSGC